MVLKDLEKRVVVVGVSEKQYTPKNSNDVKTLYQLGICTELGETGMIRCSGDVAVAVRDDKFKRFTEHKIFCSYNDQYDSMIVDRVE